MSIKSFHRSWLAFRSFKVFAFVHAFKLQVRTVGYQTGSALILIEAKGNEPLEVKFFDETPDVEITLCQEAPENRPLCRIR